MNQRLVHSKIKFTPEYIRNLSYTDFVGVVNQWNVLPGAYSTLNKWIVMSRITKDARVLECASTTGFSSRELALLTGCKAEGFDISKKSIETAEYNKKLYAPMADLKYFVADGYKFNTSKKYSHIIVGAALKFFPDPEKMLEKLIGMLDDGGYILATPFYISRPIPQVLIDKAKKVFEFDITTAGYHDIMSLYNKLEIQYEERNDIMQETEDEMQYYCSSTINRVSIELNIKDPVILDAMNERLFEIKRMSNDLRPYQNYSVLVLRYRKSTYPNRYTELF